VSRRPPPGWYERDGGEEWWGGRKWSGVRRSILPPASSRLVDDGATAQYDARRGAAGYAQIIGVFGSLSLPAITVLFTSRPNTRTWSRPLIYSPLRFSSLGCLEASSVPWA
jgi:hypothetical protein